MLDVYMKFKKGILFVRPVGVLNGDTSLKLDEDLTNVINNNGIKYVVVNLSSLEYIDYYGIKVIINNYINIKNNNGRFMICGLDNLLSYSGLIMNNLYKLNNEKDAFEVINI